MISVSIIIPVYNVSESIDRCLLSVCNQTYKNVECIIVNDATPDDSMEKVKAFLKGYKGTAKFEIISHERNLGLSSARNSGVNKATGDYIFFLDSDDELYSKDVITLFNRYIIQFGNVDFIVGGCEVIGGSSILLQSEVYRDKDDILIDYLEHKWGVIACAKFIKRSFFVEKELWFKEGVLHEDILFSFKMAFHAMSMVSMYENVYKYYIRCGSITTQMRYKNYEDYQAAMMENYTLYCQKKNIDRKAFSSYFIQGMFGFLCSAINNPNITKSDVKDLIIKYKNVVKSVDLVTPITLKIYIEYMFFKMNPFLFNFFVTKFRIGKNE